MYKIDEVKQVCQKLYGKPIPDSTWRKWRQYTGVGAIQLQDKSYIQRKTYTDREAYYLAAYAFLKRKNPHKHLTLPDVLKELKTSKDLQNLAQISIQTDCVKGSKLPQTIEALTGKKLSTRTFYRIASKLNIEFSVNKNYGKNEIEKFLSYFEN